MSVHRRLHVKTTGKIQRGDLPWREPEARGGVRIFGVVKEEEEQKMVNWNMKKIPPRQRRELQMVKNKVKSELFYYGEMKV